MMRGCCPPPPRPMGCKLRGAGTVSVRSLSYPQCETAPGILSWLTRG